MAKFRDLMCEVKYSPVIGWGTHTSVWSQSRFPGYGTFPANHRLTGLYFTLYINQITELCQTTE